MPATDDFTLREAERLKVSRYEQVSSMILAMVLLLALTVTVLLIAWLTNRVLVREEAVPVVMEEIGGGGEGGLGGGENLEPPPLDEVPPIEPEFEQTLESIPSAVASQTMLLKDPIAPKPMRRGWGGGRGTGIGTGVGPGTGFGGGTGGGRARRWEVVFLEGNTIDTYARQLDFFGIELGVILPEGQVAYASNLAQGTPVARRGPADQEKRYYLTWRTGTLQEADEELLTRAGIEARGRIIVKFLPQTLEAQLVAMVKARAGDEYNDVRRVRFGVRPQGAGFAFYIMDISYR